jgi:hypothetical protein
MHEPTPPLYSIPAGVETRWASPENPEGLRGEAGKANSGRKGAAYFPLKAGEERVLAQAQGVAGTVRRIWVTLSDRSPKTLRGLRVDFFFDGAARPAVSAPLGDFFGTGLGRTTPFESALFSSPEGRSFCCFAPMPFRTAMRLAVTNESSRDIEAFFYDVNYTLGDPHDSDTAFFHACWRRENPTGEGEDFEILPAVAGRGRFIGTNVGVIVNRGFYHGSWWGEGEVKIYIDGDRDYPTLCGTGTEDYIGTGWAQGRFANLYSGCHVADAAKMQFCFYRYHLPDPVYFAKEIRATIQQIGCFDPETRPLLHGREKPIHAAGPGRVPLDLSKEGDPRTHGLFERSDDWSCCSCFYLDRSESGLPPLAPVEKRLEGLA